ncbi:unnamed protein product [Scytosiphon promiscuus]
MSQTPNPENQQEREKLRGIEKQIFTVVTDRSDRRFEWLMPVMQRIVMREYKEAKKRRRRNRDPYVAHWNTGDEDEDEDEAMTIQPPRPGAFEDQVFDCAAEGTYLKWRDFLQIPIEAAAFAGRRDLVERLVLAGGPSERIMVEAAKGGHEQFVADMSLFLKRIYSTEGADEDGNTALHVAARHGREQMARTLLANGSTTETFNNVGDTPLHVAVKYGRLSVARVLLLTQADACIEQDIEATHDDEFTEKAGICNCPLRLAVFSGKNRLAMMELLLLHGAEVDGGGEDDYSPLLAAAMNDDLDAANFLLEAGASLQDDDKGESISPISAAARASNLEMALSLLKYGSRPNVKEFFGQTTLGFAATCPEMVDLLLRWGADETDLGKWKESPRPSAKEQRVRMLLANASKDRAWRRRGLPVLCRAFPDRCLLEQEHQIDGTQARAVWVEPVPLSRKRQKSTSQWVFAAPCSGRRGLQDLGSSVDGDGGNDTRKNIAVQEFGTGTASLLVSLREDSVFRQIVEYL